MALDGQSLSQIHVENVIDYAQYITQVANLDHGLQSLQGLHGLQALPDGTTVAFIDSSVFDPSQLFDSGAIEVHQTLAEGTVDLQQCHQVILEQPLIEQVGVQAASLEILDVKPPIGKGPFNCSLCDKVFNKWNQLQRHLKTHDEDKPFRCNQCSMSYNIEDNLLLHLATHVGPDHDPVCPECGKKFSRVASLKAHIMMHEKEENLMCTECGDEFSVQHQLDRHLLQHRQESDGMRTYQCRQCNQEYGRMSALKEHMKQHYKVRASLHHRNYKRNIDRTGFCHRCKHCNKTFQKPSQLERHERIHTGERPFECCICQRTFNQKGALQMHMTKHTGARPHTCNFCPMTFAQKGNLRSHIQRVHTLNKEEHGMIYECEECSCMFRRLGSLNAHISRAHADPAESSQAMVQDIKVPLSHSLHHLTDMNDSSVLQDVLELDHTGNDLTVSSLVDGQVIHGSLDQGTSDILQQALENSGLPSTVGDDHDGYSKEVVGTSSGKNSTSSAGMHGNLSRLGTMAIHDAATGLFKRHYIRKVNGIRWHQCTYCTKEFKKPSDLVRHIRIHTHEKPYKCTQCFRAFAVKSTLTAHIKTHTGVKEFRCDVCNKMFSTQGSLKVHLRLHTGAKPFACTHCDKKFRTSAHCKAHSQSHAKDPDSAPRPRRSLKRDNRHDNLLTDIPLQEPILITDTGLIQQPPRNPMFPPFASESGNPERPYKCSHCRRGFKKSSHLKQHIRSHTGEKPFRCNLCQRSFVSSGVLKAHARTHSGEKSHKCLVCDAMFTTGGSLKRHMSTHSEVRPFMCPYCQKTFKTSVNCKKHMKTHRHELAMQHYQTVKEGDGSGVAADGGEGRGEDDGEIVEVDGLNGSQTLADLDVLQEQVIGHTTTVGQSDLQVVEINQADLQSGAVTSNSLAVDATLQQAFGHGMFGHNFTLVNQQQFVELGGSQGTVQVGASDDKHNEDDVKRVAVKLEGQLDVQTNVSLPQSIGGQVPTQFTYQPQTFLETSTALASVYEQQQTTSMNVMDDSQSSPQDNQDEEDDEDDENGDYGNDEVEDLREGQHHDLAQMSPGASSIGRRGFRCHICSKIFKRSSHLNHHMKIHNTDKSFPCPECSKPFSSALVLKSHLRSHAGLKAHMCSLCNAAFSTAVSLRRHMIQHNNVKSYVCELCNERFKNSAQLRRHWLVKDCQANPSPTIDMISKANDENQTPKRVTRLRSVGQQQLYSDEQVSISEKILMESTSEKDRISMPKEIQSQTLRRGRFPNMCSHCPKSFKKPSDLLRHLRIHTGEKPFVCEICQRSFTVKSTLDSHMRTHKTAEKSFLCHVCNSMFSTKGSLKVHMRLHTGAKPFKCIHCDLRFRTSGHRKSHMISHFRPEGVNKKKMTKAPTQPLMSSSQESNVQPQMYILTSNQQNMAQNSASINQVVGLDQAIHGQVIDQTMGNQVISVDQSMLQGQTMMPVQLTVGDGTSGDGSGLQTQVLQGLDGSLQLQISAPIGQLGHSFQLASLDSGMIQQALHLDASVLHQLQQSGFITITPSGIQPTLTADLSQVGADIPQGAVVVSSSLANAENLLGHAMTATDSIVGQQTVHGTEVVSGVSNVISQPIVVSDALMSQIHNSEGLLVHSVKGRTTAVSHNMDNRPMPIYTSTQVMGGHRLSDALLSQQSVRLHGSSGVTNSLIGQAGHSSQDNYQSQGVTQTSDAVIGPDRIMTSMSDALIGRQISYGDAVMGAAGEHALIQGMHLQVGSMSDTVTPNIMAQSMAALQGHQAGKSSGVDQGNMTLMTQDGQRLTVNVFTGSSQDLDLGKISEVDEDEQKYSMEHKYSIEQKYSIPGDDSRMSNIAHLDQNPTMAHHLDDDVEEDNSEEVDTNALIPTSDVVSLERQQEGANRHHICGICYKGFKRAAHLREHINIHGPGHVPKKPKATPHKCNVCNKAFQKPSQVERHMRIHTGERPFTCHICNKAFNQKNALQVHLRKHSGEKPHICPYCSSSFVQSGNLKTHIKRAHHTDMVNTMNFARTAADGAGGTGQDVGGHEVPTGLDEAQSGMGGEVHVSTVGGMEHEGMDLVEVVDLFVQ